jgi:hypothetical protein
MELLLRGLLTPLTEAGARVHLQRAWYAAVGSATVMLLGGLFGGSFGLLMGGLIVVGLGHGMLQRSWIAAAVLWVYLVSVIARAGWDEGRPVLLLVAAVAGYFVAQGVRATWWWWRRSLQDTPAPDSSEAVPTLVTEPSRAADERSSVEAPWREDSSEYSSR